MTDPVGILFLHSSSDLYGSDRSLLRIIGGLDKRLFRSHVVLPCDGPLVAKIEQAGASVHCMELGILRRRYATPWGALRQSSQILMASFHLARFVRKNNIALIQSNTLAVQAGGLAACWAGVPHAWYVREIVESPVSVRNALAFGMRCFADKIIAVSHAAQRFWTNVNPKLGKKMAVVQTGLQDIPAVCSQAEARKKLGLPADGLLVGMVGRINRVKGHGVFLEMAKNLAPAHPKAFFVCLGDVPQGEYWRREEILENIAREGMDEKFLLLPFDEDIAMFYTALDIVAVPSVVPDAFPAVCIEAGFFAKPVVAFATGGISEIVQDGATGFCVPSGSNVRFQERLAELLSDASLREKLGRQGREYCLQHFSLSRQIGRLQEIYTMMVEKPK